MSYLFVYQSDKHLSLTGERSYYGGEQMHTHYGVFDKATMWRAFKRDYTVHGYGEHDMQRFLERNDMVRKVPNFVGHLIELPSAKQAIWLKLNYDRISKVERCNYLACYKDLNPDDLFTIAQKLKEAKAEAREMSNHQSVCYRMANQVSSLKDTMSSTSYSFEEDDIAVLDGFYNQVSTVETKWKKRYDRATRKIKLLENKIIAYMKEHEV